MSIKLSTKPGDLDLSLATMISNPEFIAECEVMTGRFTRTAVILFGDDRHLVVSFVDGKGVEHIAPLVRKQGVQHQTVLVNNGDSRATEALIERHAASAWTGHGFFDWSSVPLGLVDAA